MVLAEFMRFYHYSVDEAMELYAVTFFALVNSMYQIQAKEMINDIKSVASAMSKDPQSVIDKLEKSANGLHGIIQEVKNIKEINK